MFYVGFFCFLGKLGGVLAQNRVGGSGGILPRNFTLQRCNVIVYSYYFEIGRKIKALWPNFKGPCKGVSNFKGLVT